MRVWYVMMDFSASRFLAVEVHEMRRQGADVQVVTFRPSFRGIRQYRQDWDLEDVPIDSPGYLGQIALCLRHPFLTAYLLTISAWGIRHNWRKIFPALICCPRAIQIAHRAKREKPDFIHLGWGHFPALIGIALRWLKVKQLWAVDLSDYSLQVRFGPTLKAVSDAEFVRVISDMAFEDATDFGVDRAKLRMIPRGQDVRAWRPTDNLRVPFRIVTSARLAHVKRIDLCLRVLAELRKENSDWELHVAGNGPLRRQLGNLATRLGVASSVRFLGELSPRELQRETWQATFFLLLSDSECLPNSLKEAMAAGCLCITSRTPGIDQLLRDGEHGLVVPTNDVSAAVAAIRSSLDEDSRAKMIAAAQEHVIAEFDVEQTVGELMKLWHASVSANRVNLQNLAEIAE